ncbi:MAG: SGNH/GDSL hydrolase family protein [Actinomycetota bacterium]|nr:SGNH/GDSL hydrolase family protein [Actinomycetota bacterium]
MAAEPSPGPLPRRGIARLRVFDRTVEQVQRYADAWRAANTTELAASGPLWAVLGDSAAQGVGAASMQLGYVGQLRRMLEARDGTEWRVINLSRSGARTREVVQVQLPALAQLGVPPDLVTAVVGGNDILHTRPARWRRDIDELVSRVPAGTLVATVSRGLRERKVGPINDYLLGAAARRDLPVADIWAHTGPPYRGKYADPLHPNERGYADWTAALAAALGLPAAGG